MLRKLSTVAFATALSIASPLAAAPPFGSFGGIHGGGNSGAGVIRLQGWALDDDGVAAVDIMVDGLVVGRAHYGRSRPGVTAQFPGFPDSALPGFAFPLDSTHFLNGLHKVGARVRSNSGEIVNLNQLVLEFGNVTHNLAPFGVIEFPNTDVELLGDCSLTRPSRRYAVVSGFALDVGVENGDQGVGYLELLIDGAIHRHTLTDCHFDPAKGGLSDCYGFARFDIRQAFSVVPDPPLVGYRFVLDIGELIALDGYVPGRHVLKIRAGDVAGNVSIIDEINAFFSCDDFLGNEASFGEIRRPRDGLTYSGIIEAGGWALDINAVAIVRVYVDGVAQGDAELGFARPGVTSLYPGYPDSAAPGWRLFLDTRTLSNGRHNFQVEVFDFLGAVTLLGERDFVVFNPP